MLLYTETAFHHEGDFDYLCGLIDATADAGADAVKFQVLADAGNLISTRHSGFETLSRYVFSRDRWQQAFEYAVHRKLKLVIMPLDPPALDFLAGIREHIAYLEIHPVCLNDMALLESVREAGLPLIIGIGGRTTDEIRDWQVYFGDQLKVLMCGFQAFPSKLQDIKLERIPWLRQLFPDQLIGYADHSGYADPDAIRSNSVAWQLGARLFEKHITITEGTQRVDYESAVGPDKISQIITNLRALASQGMETQNTIGDTAELSRMSDAESKYRKRTKVTVAAHHLQSGQTLELQDVALKMIDKEGGYFRPDDVIGRRLTADISADDIITPAVIA